MALDERFDLFVVDPGGGSAPRRLTSSFPNVPQVRPGFVLSPVGTDVIFQTGPIEPAVSPHELYVVPLAPGATAHRLAGSQYDPIQPFTVSADGLYVVFRRDSTVDAVYSTRLDDLG